MDNRITKKRLSEYLSYEWIMLIIVMIIGIVVWELIYTVGAVRLTVGQEFKYYYDETIDSGNDNDFYDLIRDKLSYDVISLSTESLTSKYNVLSARLSVQEGDVIFTDKKIPEKEEGKDDKEFDKSVRIKTLVDGGSCAMYDFEKLLEDAEKYLRDNFFKEEFIGADLSTLEYKEENIDGEKLKSVFLERMKKDNRFRKAPDKEKGLALETERIKQLCKDVSDFKHFMETAPDEVFFRYTRFEQAKDITEDKESKARYEEAYNKEIENGKENAIYGINLEALQGGEKNPSTYFRMRGSDPETTTAKDVVLAVFDFKSYQPHLQYEVLTFINTILRECSNFLD